MINGLVQVDKSDKNNARIVDTRDQSPAPGSAKDLKEVVSGFLAIQPPGIPGSLGALALLRQVDQRTSHRRPADPKLKILAARVHISHELAR